MRLPVEKWLEEQDFDENIRGLFNESIICYKASAYRASLLFSFLGFQTVIRERIIKAEKPGNIHPKAWEAIKSNLRKEDSWDMEVNESIKKNDENKRLFIMTDDLRQQAIYWKNRRNDCAHSKSNIIDSSHIESFWFFLFSNLSKFVVNGSKESLIQKIDRHFDLNLTREDEDFTYIIKEIPNALYEEDILDFLHKLDNVFMENETWYPIIAERAMSFFNQLINLGDPYTSKSIDFIKKDNDLEESFLNAHPDKVTYFYGNNQSEIRHLWRVKFNSFGSVKYKILARLLSNGFVTDEKEEVFNHIIRTSKSSFPSTNDATVLEQHGYFNQYKSLVFSENIPLIHVFDWGNNADESVGMHLNLMGLDAQIVKSINRTFLHEPFPFKLQKSLSKYFSEGEVRDKYIQVCDELGISPTEHLGF
ncbi:hypothetical protein [Sutcliffiella rhizosphaerae]|uniref:Uncharacterized protein n=1 Tax=Sutcliffiella rhizosphaerae TaxID=2880967 RepID=A0ABN8A720_9BACI|nr:hypothetical protein [Sutcliffiella rhizosphaerae]CAG9620863.1 hypothetical protein BACCIP111883_01634 [Sutcliffiella rhizosphaerae]